MNYLERYIDPVSLLTQRAQVDLNLPRYVNKGPSSALFGVTDTASRCWEYKPALCILSGSTPPASPPGPTPYKRQHQRMPGNRENRKYSARNNWRNYKMPEHSCWCYVHRHSLL